ncbi:2-succinyl-5-enolpyruvyl-6-hydroxy-3-cyclohexene-1-carboxylic-acid synthase [Corynebacterium sp. 3HC-13]|uniref:2-succinyl-5-enolpyruvyl-6-hydroxy-3- cyclohexene-1-carboxylic-acid synthase n=1 Tax=Corynebacterium poyangense TaxID=2684405 RepID=UPI001CCAD814|nr:2-succinyl-5-enolpyruvyl-6-hydroxy-3-cyclohexene-1-carboxylic-acid synthase [Corynebacterium poyangense]MBZ8177658.1 2-succinyl-5-enolpyruvyl-6-hydroxy-3-cyclohexene-1-carboxylic-acid synthase [Corynebacterium poyangense]
MSQPPAFELAHHVIRRCLDAEVRDVVLCPGSRNSPLSFALTQYPELRLHVRVDERSASFLALGLSRVTRRPVPVVMTSGTAVAECLAAVVEAAHSHQRLVVLSADRPSRLVGTGASQTITQLGLFSSVIPSHQIETAQDTHRIPDIIQAAGAGPTHLNIAFDTPLLPTELAPRQDTQPRLAPTPLPPQVWDHGEVCIDLRRRPLVISGDEAWEIEELADLPTLAEPTAPAPFHPVHPAAAGLLRKGSISQGEYQVDTRPEQVIVVGHPTLHRDVLALISDSDIDVICLSQTAQFTDLGRQASAYGTRVRTVGAVDKQWQKICHAASDLAADTIRQLLAEPEYGFHGVHVAAAISDGLGVGDTLFVGASNPVRDLSLVGLPFGGVPTYSPRGAAGIDGSISQAVGIALATQALAPTDLRAPRTIAYLGDLTFLHDINGLAIGPTEPHPENLTLVVANDGGGGIFESLESGAPGLREHFERVVATPTQVDIAALCQGYQVHYRRVENLEELLQALADSVDYSPGMEVIEVMTSRAGRRAFHEAIRQKLG